MKNLQSIKKDSTIKSIQKEQSMQLKGGGDRIIIPTGGCPPPEDD